MLNVADRLGSGIAEMHLLGARMIGAVTPASLAHEAVLYMEMDLLRQGWPVGQSLGALPQLQKRLGLGRPASREAVTILEARGLLDVRRGPGGGLFVAAPALEDVAGAALMYLALNGGTHACIVEFRLLVWRMVVTAAVQRRAAPPAWHGAISEWGLAVELAERAGNRTMGHLAQLAEILVRISSSGAVPPRSKPLETAIGQGNLSDALKHLDALLGPVSEDAPVVALGVPERGFSLAGRKSAMALAARLARELGAHTGTQEAEWETADRLGYTDAAVRQARRILQDFGIVRCRRGRKGTELAPPAPPTGVIRLLAACLVASAGSPKDLREAIHALISSAPALAARRVKATGLPPSVPSSPATGPDAFELLTLENRLLDLTGNPLLAIIVRSLGLANIFVEREPPTPLHLSDVMGLNRRILRAIESGDVTTADILATAKLQLMQRSDGEYQGAA